jgi:hypothetical protein
MRLFWTFVLTSVCAFGATPVSAQSTSADPIVQSFNAAKGQNFDAVRVMFAACHYRDQIEATFDGITASNNINWTITHANWSREEHEEYVKDYRAALESRLERYVAIDAIDYAKSFTPEELAAMADFCRTPLGDSYFRKRADMVKKGFYAHEAAVGMIFQDAEMEASAKMVAREKKP